MYKNPAIIYMVGTNLRLQFWIILLLFIVLLFIIKGSMNINIEGMETTPETTPETGEKKTSRSSSSVAV